MQRKLNAMVEGAVSVVQNPSGKVNDPHSASFFDRIRISPGLTMIVVNQARHEGLKMDFQIDHAPVSFSYNLSQRVRCTMTSGPRFKRVMERSPGDSVLAYLPRTRGTLDIVPDKRMMGVSFHFSESCFRELFKEVPESLKFLGSPFSRHSGKQYFYHQARFNHEALFALRQILGCPYGGETRRLYLEAKSLELVALKLAELGQNNLGGVPNLNRKDLDRAREAYHILLTNLDDPPSLVDLSRLVGTNRNKLNQGFKEIYGDTVFNVLRNARLTNAWSLLKQTDLSLSEIAFSVGYNNQANFTTAFRRHFGITPKALRDRDALVTILKERSPG